MKVGRHECTPICCTCVTVKVSLYSLLKRSGQFSSLLSNA
jgi:hypothetical protein